MKEKIKVLCETKIELIRVQERLFDLGYVWISGTRSVQNFPTPLYPFVPEKEGVMTFSRSIGLEVTSFRAKDPTLSAEEFLRTVSPMKQLTLWPTNKDGGYVMEGE